MKAYRLFYIFVAALLIGFVLAGISLPTEQNNAPENQPIFSLVDPEEIKGYIHPEQKAIDVLHYELRPELIISKKHLRAKASITCTFLDNIEKPDFNFYDNLKIDSLTVNGKNSNYERKNNHLFIDYPAKAGDTLIISISYYGKPKRKGLAAFTFGKINGQSLVYNLNEPVFASTWFPCIDRPTDKAMLDMYITNDSTEVSVSNGRLVSVETKEDKKTYHWKTEYPISTYLVCLYSSDYEQFNDTYVNEKNDTLDLQYYVLSDYVERAKQDFANHPKFIEVFSELFGEYPFMKEKYGVAQFLWNFGAMEHQTITGVGSVFIRGDNYFEDLYVHELAHHWWGNAIAPATWNDIWLNEGFATYSEALYYEKVEGPEALKRVMDSKFYTGFQETLYAPENDIFSKTVYDKGAYVLHMLRFELGDPMFFQILRTYFEKYKHSFANTENFQTLCEEISGRNLDKFFEQWVYEGKGIIRLEYSERTEQINDEFAVYLKMEQVQKSYEFYEFPLEILYRFADGSSKTIRYEIKRPHEIIAETFDSEPVKIVFDPNKWLLAEIDEEITKADQD